MPFIYFNKKKMLTKKEKKIYQLIWLRQVTFQQMKTRQAKANLAQQKHFIASL